VTLTMDISRETSVGMGQMALAQSPGRLRSVVGSCVAVTLYHPRSHWGALGHVVLPDSQGRTGSAGRFVNTAIPQLIAMLAKEGANQKELVAKIAGGASMFNTTGPLRIGDANGEAVLRALRAAGIRVAGQDLGGIQGRRVTLDCATGAVAVEIAGGPARTL
jgi:chemotaxis protein CheD